MILTKKHEAWCNSIADEKVKELAQKNTIITGGALASMLLKEEIHDFDFYFTNFETCKVIAEYYVQQFIKEHDDLKIKPQVMIDKDFDNKDRVHIMIKSAGIVGDNTNDKNYQYFEGRPINEGEEYVDEAIGDPTETLQKSDNIDAQSIGNLHGHNTEKGKFRPIFLTDNAITLSDKTQIIIRFYGDAKEIHKNFDFVHCTNYWQSDTKQLVLRQEALESLLSKRLYYMNSQYPICALIRIRKFLKRGFYIDAGNILKICFQISKLDLENINVLKSQLVGVDQAYFIQLIDFIEQEKAKNENWVIDLPYLASIIDRIF